MKVNKVYWGDNRVLLKTFPDQSVDCIVTSPPYFGKRNYNVKGQIGLEQHPDEYINELVNIFNECKRILKDTGTFWLNIDDSYYNYRPGKGQKLWKQSVAKTDQDLPSICPRRANKLNGYKEKDLIGIPWMAAFALRADGWWLRQDIIWDKNAMPESMKDRCTKSHEYIFLLAKNKNYYFDYEAILERANYDGRKATRMKGSKKYNKENIMANGKPNTMASQRHERWKEVNGIKVRRKRSIWKVSTANFKGAHHAVFPEALIRPCILAGCPEGGVVLDPFMGAGTTGCVCKELNRNYVGIELNKQNVIMARERIKNYKFQKPLICGKYNVTTDRY
jgi:DNA modification methylase